jgi:hypothetical protein
MSLDINVVRCEALFASSVQSSESLVGDQLSDAIMRTVRALGSRGCTAVVAKEFGDHPESAVRRMRWAREQVAALVRKPRSIAAIRALATAPPAA